MTPDTDALAGLAWDLQHITGELLHAAEDSQAVGFDYGHRLMEMAEDVNAMALHVEYGTVQRLTS